MADKISKNDGKISTKCPPTNFRDRRLQIYCQLYKLPYEGSNMADEIFKNNGKISTKCPPKNFRGRRLRIYCQIYKIQDGAWIKKK